MTDASDPDPSAPGRPSRVYLFPHVCFVCRKSFRRLPLDEPRKCPDCGGATVRLSRKFKAPKRGDLQAWRVVAYVVRSGFRYQPIYLENGELVAYPRTLREAEAFVRRHGPIRPPP